MSTLTDKACSLLDLAIELMKTAKQSRESAEARVSSLEAELRDASEDLSTARNREKAAASALTMANDFISKVLDGGDSGGGGGGDAPRSGLVDESLGFLGLGGSGQAPGVPWSDMGLGSLGLGANAPFSFAEDQSMGGALHVRAAEQLVDEKADDGQYFGGGFVGTRPLEMQPAVVPVPMPAPAAAPASAAATMSPLDMIRAKARAAKEAMERGSRADAASSTAPAVALPSASPPPTSASSSASSGAPWASSRVGSALFSAVEKGRPPPHTDQPRTNHSGWGNKFDDSSDERHFNDSADHNENETGSDGNESIGTMPWAHVGATGPDATVGAFGSISEPRVPSRLLYVRGFTASTTETDLAKHIDKAINRFYRPGAYVSGISYLRREGESAAFGALVEFSSARYASAAIALDDALLCDGARLSFRRPQDYSANVEETASLQPIIFNVRREIEGETYPDPEPVEWNARPNTRLTSRAESSQNTRAPVARPSAVTAAALSQQQAQQKAASKKAKKSNSEPLEASEVELIAQLRALMTKPAAKTLEYLCAHDGRETSIMFDGLVALCEALDKLNILVSKYNGSDKLLIHGVGTGQMASHSIDRPRKTSDHILLHSVAAIRSILRSVQFPEHAFA